MIMGMILAVTMLIGSLLMYMSFLYGEMRGHERGLDEAEQIARDEFGLKGAKQ